MTWTNQLYYGDNLRVLREEIRDESVDLVYLDPPFNSAANYNVLFREASGEQSAAQITAFEDTWHWMHDSNAPHANAARRTSRADCSSPSAGVLESCGLCRRRARPSSGRFATGRKRDT